MHTSIETEYSAPEILGFIVDGSEESSKYTNAVDMWSLGCLLHWLLTQRLPLTKWEMMPYCLERMSFPTQHLAERRVGLQGIDFIQKVMTPQPKDRINAFEALRHGWPHDFSNADATAVQQPSFGTLDHTSISSAEAQAGFETRSRPNHLSSDLPALATGPKSPKSVRMTGSHSSMTDPDVSQILAPEVREDQTKTKHLVGRVLDEVRAAGYLNTTLEGREEPKMKAISKIQLLPAFDEINRTGLLTGEPLPVQPFRLEDSLNIEADHDVVSGEFPVQTQEELHREHEHLTRMEREAEEHEDREDHEDAIKQLPDTTNLFASLTSTSGLSQQETTTASSAATTFPLARRDPGGVILNPISPGSVNKTYPMVGGNVQGGDVKSPEEASDSGPEQLLHPSDTKKKARDSAGNMKDKWLDRFLQLDTTRRKEAAPRMIPAYDRTQKLNDLIRFSKTFRLKTPVPPDLVEILAKTSSKEEASNGSSVTPPLANPPKARPPNKPVMTWAAVAAGRAQNGSTNPSGADAAGSEEARKSILGETQLGNEALDSSVTMSRKQKRKKTPKVAKTK
jgi:serine/threonine protein kinase